ncbi:MAG: RnfABCDGE type electron transport complex subunit G [Lachnospiraceae bacterium]|nr:RnfABCDGE type electron transport complex subunit G [Lachnospiraceae bacterium]
MNNEIKSMLKDAGIIVVITLIAGLVLGGVYQLTKEPIAEQKRIKKQNACQEVFAEAASFAETDGFDADAAALLLASEYPSQDIDEVMTAQDASGNTLGYVLTVTTHEGYGGDIQFTMGITNEGLLKGISLLSISETAGLGMRADEVLKPQFAGKSAEKYEYTKTGAVTENQIDAISGATITTNAVVNGVNAGLYYFQNELGGGAE